MATPGFGVSDSDANFRPVGRTVARPSEPRGIHKRLQQYRPSPISVFPVVQHCPRTAGDEERGKVRNADPGQDQESAVVHDKFAIPLPLMGRPADPGITGLLSPGRITPAETGDRISIVVDDVLHLSADDARRVEIMVTLHEVVPDARFGVVFRSNTSKLERGVLDRRNFFRQVISRRFSHLGRPSRATPFGRGQRDDTHAVEFPKDFAAGHVLQVPIRLAPAKCPTNAL